MSNVIMSARTATSDVFGAVSETTKSASHGIKALGHYSEVLEAHAKDYKETYIRTLAGTQDHRVSQKLNRMAEEAATEEARIARKCKDNPEFAKHYEEALASFIAADKAAQAKLSK